jgi:hypothetical protein
MSKNKWDIFLFGFKCFYADVGIKRRLSVNRMLNISPKNNSKSNVSN